MIESLRGLGYSASTALADVIDNSLAAGADEIRVQFTWAGMESTISILDNGHGMTDSQLESALRLGNRNPLDARSIRDLGRFGLGLKTASFSQCRCLTVASVRDGEKSCLRWDLEALAEADGWELLEGPRQGSENNLQRLYSQSRGTLVLWEQLDRILGPGFGDQAFLDLIDRVERHLAVVFQRFLCRPRGRIRIFINDRPIQPIDPFLSQYSAWSSPVDRFEDAGDEIQVQCYVLPHRDRLDPKVYDSVAGPEGWTAHQGFYVYRNERLLVAGSWLGLGRNGKRWTKDEAHRLARIRVDIPNTADARWRLDIRKSMARPPQSIRDRLTRLAEDTRTRARAVFAHRGAQSRGANSLPLVDAWAAEHSSTGVRYRINAEHPAIAAVLAGAGTQQEEIRAMLRVLEATVPVQRIWLDTAESRETPRTAFAGEPSEDVMGVLKTLYRSLRKRRGLSAAEARDQLLRTEPFGEYLALVSALPDDTEE
jgi:hypothetical protein